MTCEGLIRCICSFNCETNAWASTAGVGELSRKSAGSLRVWPYTISAGEYPRPSFNAERSPSRIRGKAKVYVEPDWHLMAAFSVLC